MIRLLLVLSVLFAAIAGASPQPHANCRTNAECLKRGLPLRPPTRRAAGQLRPRTSALPPTPSTFSLTGTVQVFNPQQDGFYTITMTSASGGLAGAGSNIGNPGPAGGAGGLGLRASAVVYLKAGTSLSVVVGGMGAPGNYQGQHAGGGGGGSFVYLSAAPSDPILVAGGGGGGGWKSSATSTVNADGSPGSSTTSGTSGGGASPGTGGTGGHGGAAGSSPQWNGAGGAGWSSSGANVADSTNDLGHGSGYGGLTGPSWAGGEGDGGDSKTYGDNKGGYGGGAGGGFDGGGGGGGYSGGGGGGGDGNNAGGSGGGGGSFAIGSFNTYPVTATFTALTAPGNGMVTFVKN